MVRAVARTKTVTPTLKPDKDSGTGIVIRRDDTGVYVGSRKYSLGEIARGTGITRPYITRIFNGKRKPSLSVTECVSGFLGVPIEAFLAFLRRP